MRAACRLSAVFGPRSASQARRHESQPCARQSPRRSGCCVQGEVILRGEIEEGLVGKVRPRGDGQAVVLVIDESFMFPGRAAWDCFEATQLCSVSASRHHSDKSTFETSQKLPCHNNGGGRSSSDRKPRRVDLPRSRPSSAHTAPTGISDTDVWSAGHDRLRRSVAGRDVCGVSQHVTPPNGSSCPSSAQEPKAPEKEVVALETVRRTGSGSSQPEHTPSSAAGPWLSSTPVPRKP